jgi:hypothetical protein
MSVYFFFQDEKPGQAGAHALAESLALCGAEFYAPFDWWYASPEAIAPLFKHDPVFDPCMADVVIVGRSSFRSITPDFQVKVKGFPEWLTAPARKFKLVYLEEDDNYEAFAWKPPFDQFDIVLRTHMNRRAYQPANFRPWQLGVSCYVIERAGQKLAGVKKRLCILSNFNATHPFEHPLRRLAREKIVPRFEKFLPIDRTVLHWDKVPEDPFDALHFKQARKYYNPAYHDLLAGAAACFAFCGDLVPGLPHNPAPMLRGGNKGKLKRAVWDALSTAVGATPRALQWDSFRFWECLAFACCPIHVDLDKYGVDLPIMPKNWEHYIGLDLDHLDRDLDRIRKHPEILLEIGARGRQWLVDAYGGTALATLFMGYLGIQRPDSLNPRGHAHRHLTVNPENTPCKR